MLINNYALYHSINQIRFSRFETALRNVLEGYTPESTGTSSSSGSSGNSSSSGAVNTNQSGASLSNNPYANANANSPPRGFHNRDLPAPPGGTAATTTVAPVGPAPELDDIKEYTRRVLGHYYMEIHGVGASSGGFNVHIEDARMVLKAFWYMSENRLHADMQSTVDQMILQKISADIEKELLSQFQIWSTSPGSSISPDGQYSVGEMLHEKETVTHKRKELISQRSQYNEALKKIHDMQQKNL